MEVNYSEIENKWKKKWKEDNLYKVQIDPKKPKFYVLDMFPYPSGSGLHVGHPLGYIASDIVSRYKKMEGFNVLHPMGFDAFGLPAEQYAIQTGVHPAKSTADNISMYHKQLDNIGFNYDWSNSVNTSDPNFYKWTQWIFIQLFQSYYDQKSDQAQPINELISHFEKHGTSELTAYNPDEISFTSEEWNKMGAGQKDDALMSFRLAYRKTSFVNWCEALGTVLANDEVKDGVSERGGHPVERRALLQWSLRITAYAERLLNGLNDVEWSEALKTMQRNWIGKSSGAQIHFSIANHDEKIEIFTTRPDTIFGSTFMVLAPEHTLVSQLTTDDQKTKIDDYQKYVSSKTELERKSEVKEVTGCFTGSYAIHPFTEMKMPIYIAEYVLMDYGSGAIMAVPSDDERDNVFAKKYDLPIIPVVDKSNHPNASMSDKVGVMQNSGFLNGMKVKKAIGASIQKLIEEGIGTKQTQYKLRDANFSRQRYWGEPFPIVYKDGVTTTLDEDKLPLELPSLDNFKPTPEGKSPLARLEDWIQTKDGVRESDTMPGYAGSSWYFLRYMDAKNDNEFASKKSLEYWKDVDLYIGGTEHAVGHLMYSRFWHKFLYDLGLVPTTEPFKRLVNQGMIQGVIEFIYLYKEKRDGQSVFYSAELVEDDKDYAKIPVHIDFVESYGNDDSYLSKESLEKFIDWRPEYKNSIYIDKNGEHNISSADEIHIETVSEVGKMSKRYFNVVNPDDVVAEYGADCFRMYEMFLGPIEQSKPWDTNGIDGVAKFLRKFWGLFFDENDNFQVSSEKATPEELKILHKTIKKVTSDIESLSFNTSISAFMIAVNDLKKLNCNKKEILQELVLLLAPFAPFSSEELWSMLGNTDSVHIQSYPEYDHSKTVESVVTYPVCINGKKKFLTEYPADKGKEDIEKEVIELEELQKYLDGKPIKKIIVVPGRIINLIV